MTNRCGLIPLACLILALGLTAGDITAQDRFQKKDFMAAFSPGLLPTHPFHPGRVELPPRGIGFPVQKSGSQFRSGARRSRGGGLSQRARAEIGAVALTGVGHLVFGKLGASKIYMPLVSLGWGAYIYSRTRSEPGFLRTVGFSSKGLGATLRYSTLAATGATVLMAAVAARNKSLALQRDMIPLLLLYPAWGLVQQFLVQGLVSRNLTTADGWLGSSYAVTPISAVMFASVHLPDWKLTAATFAMGMAFTPIYLKHANLWALGLYHGWLGALYYFWVLKRNPWQEVFGRRAASKVLPDFTIDVEGNPLLRLQLRL